ncbi:ABC-F family ATP-binding cassette domain-containing protein [Lacibacterium aquatile]|uniref:ABC-F family ATP-binding cassette domain-containing protein n=1 Tax=Lacibacterium aquatile TaxID=1168082 RepID=A0ABW5DMH4_9PROT
MTLIALRNLGVTLGNPLFTGLDLSIDAGNRLGIIAANGRGKSTLLRCIAGTAESTTGDIIKARGLEIGHVEQHVPDRLMGMSLRAAVLDALPPEQAEMEEWRVDVILDALSVPLDFHDKRLAELSGGWQRTTLLARVAVLEPDALLLDEPTNHLDLDRIAKLEAWLKGLPRELPVLIASHDRAFLDAVTNRTLFLRPEASKDFALPYSRARAALAEVDDADAKRYEKDMKTADQLRRQAAKLNNIGINSGSDLLVVKTKQLKERAEKLETASRPAHQERSAGAIKLANSGTHAKVLITLEDQMVETPDGKPLFRTGRLFIRQGDRIALLGRNGTGKTRLVSKLRTAIEGTGQDDIKVTPSLVLGYADQALATLPDQQSPMDILLKRFSLGEQRARSLLAGAGIAVDRQAKPSSNLSGGQKARLGMLVLRLTEPNFYLLDEPTNHLDIEGQEALEDELLDHQASCLLVSHDRSFVRTVANRFWLIEKKRLVEVDGPEEFFALFGG